MGRCKKHRCCRDLGEHRVFKPAGMPACDLKKEELEADEFEAFLLCDLEGYDQIGAGEIMGVSRGTVQRLLKVARKKVAGVLIEQKLLTIKNQEPKNDSENIETGNPDL